MAVVCVLCCAVCRLSVLWSAIQPEYKRFGQFIAGTQHNRRQVGATAVSLPLVLQFVHTAVLYCNWLGRTLCEWLWAVGRVLQVGFCK